MIPGSFVQDLLARTDIAEVIGRHVELKRSGASLLGLCPFHAEKSPSFSVSPAKSLYYCFGCGAGGDAIRFLTEHLGLSFVDAVRDLAQRAGIQVPEEDTSPEERERHERLRARRLSLTGVLERAAAFYRAQLKASPRAVEYLKARGLSGEVAARFGLGYAPPGWRTLAGVFAEYDDPQLDEAGLVRQREADDSGNAERGRYDWFRDRIMFPIRSLTGDVIGFGGRVLDASKPKYINSPETALFSKGRELYGLFEARQALRERGCALVVEGYMDVVALAQHGFANAVATLGTACTAEHVQKLFRFTDTIVFSFDGDAAGRKAAGRALQAALPHASDTRSIRFVFLPPEYDPDSFVRDQGAPAFDAAIAQAVPLSRQLIASAGEGCDLATVEGRARMLACAKPMWAALPEGVLKRQLLAEIAAAGRDDADRLERQWGGAAARPGNAPARIGIAAGAQARARRALGQGTANLLDRAVWLLLRDAELWSALDGQTHDLLAAQASPYDRLFGCIERCLHEHGPLAPSALLAELRDDAGGDSLAASVLARIASLHDPDPGADLAQELAIALDKLRLQAVDEELKQLFDSGVASPDAMRRSRELLEARRRLKAPPPTV